MKALRIALWCMVGIFAVVATYAWLTIGNGPRIREAAIEQPVKFGGPFELVRHDGTKITEADLKGRNYAVFFGFTNCPDICPTTLLQTAGWIKTLGSDADNIDFYFFSVDPERDTPEVMNDYVTAFDPKITGVTGDLKEMEKAVKAYRAYYKRIDLGEGDYTMDHSAAVLLIRADGSLQGTISFEEAFETAIAKLRRLSKNS